MNILFAIIYIFYFLSYTFAAKRFLEMFLSERHTSVGVFFGSFAAFYIINSILFLLNLRYIYLIIAIILVFVLTFNYKQPIYKRLIATISFIAAIGAIEALITGIFPGYTAAGISADYDTTLALFVISILFVAVAFIPSRFKSIKTNQMKMPSLWITAFIVPFISFLLIFWITAYFPPVLVFISICSIFLCNALSFYIHDAFADVYESRLNSIVQTNEYLQAVLDSSPIACSVIDENFNIVEANKRTAELFGISSPDIFSSDHLKFSAEKQMGDISSDEKFKEVAAKAFESGYATCDWMHCAADGTIIPCEITLRLVQLSEKIVLIRYIHDLRKINTLVEMKEQMEDLAVTDWLTGLKNRRYFMEKAESVFSEAIAGNKDFSIIMLDIDHFKNVNDSFGHSIGDEVLKIFALRLTRILGHDSIVARYGGEEFIVALPDADKDGAMTAAWRIHENIGRSPFAVGELSIPITVSVGVASKVNDSQNLQYIIDAADAAVYSVKRNGRNSVQYADNYILSLQKSPIAEFMLDKK